MKSSQISNGPQPVSPGPKQEEIDQWAARTTWSLILNGVVCGVVYCFARAVMNGINDEMGGSPAELRRRLRDK